MKFWKEGADGTKQINWQLCLIIAGAALGLLLLWMGGGETANKGEDAATTAPSEEEEALLYQSYLESRILSLCRSVNGVGDATVIVTLSGSFSSVYATEMHEGEARYVIIGNGSSAKPLYLSRIPPDIAGIGIVCTGGASPTVQEELIALLSSSLHVPSNRIHISSAKPT